MDNYKIDFQEIEWETSVGLKQKRIVRSGHTQRLVHFEHGFIEKEWCKKEHMGYVLSGEMKIDFNGHIVEYSKGDGLFING